jgi:hypothetical protein
MYINVKPFFKENYKILAQACILQKKMLAERGGGRGTFCTAVLSLEAVYTRASCRYTSSDYLFYVIIFHLPNA